MVLPSCSWRRRVYFRNSLAYLHCPLHSNMHSAIYVFKFFCSCASIICNWCWCSGTNLKALLKTSSNWTSFHFIESIHSLWPPRSHFRWPIIPDSIRRESERSALCLKLFPDLIDWSALPAQEGTRNKEGDRGGGRRTMAFPKKQHLTSSAHFHGPPE